MKKLFIIFLSFVFITGCESKQENLLKGSENDYPVKVNDITINKKPKKVAVLSDVLADIIIELGYSKQVVGRSNNCTQKEIESAVDVGNTENIDLKSIEQLSPEIVIYENEITEKQVHALKKRNISVIKLDRAKERNDLERIYVDIGYIFNGAKTGFEEGKKSARNILMTLDDVIRIVPKQTVPVTTCYLLNDQWETLKNDMFIMQIIELLGVINVAKDINGDKMDVEKMLLLNPSWIFCGIGIKEKLISNDRFKSVTAVKDDKVVELDYNLIQRQGQEMIKTITKIAGELYPELLNDSPSGVILNEVSSANNHDQQKKNQQSTEKDYSHMIVKHGDQNDSVLEIQNRLDSLNYLHTFPNNKFNDLMAQAIKDFKFLNNMSVTEDVNTDFLNKLFSENAVSRPDPAREKQKIS